MELSVELGGIQAITVLAILVTGIIGAVVAEFVFRVFRIEHPIARGIALGCSAMRSEPARLCSWGMWKAQ